MTGYLEEMKDVKKDNFDLKLKVFFLEERLGIGIGGVSVKRLSDENIDLKVYWYCGDISSNYSVDLLRSNYNNARLR